MVKRLAGSIREYKRPTVLTLIFIVLEAVIEVFIPFITAELGNKISEGASGSSTFGISGVLGTGGLLVLMALVSLMCGGLAGYTSAKASSGFAKNLRKDMFSRIQTYSFGNIDKFSSASLVTRMTTDINNAQMSYMMLIRIAVRAPLLLIFSIIVAYIMGGALATTFVVIIPVLTFGLLLIGKKAMPAFRSVFKKYDRLNESIEENVRGMRVVKSFAREDYEKQKFGAAAEDIRKDFTRAERIVALNSPLMQTCVYFNMIFVMIVGSKLIITSGGKNINFLVVERSAALQYQKHVVNKIVSPEENQTSDGWKFFYRSYGLCDVYDNKTKGIYLHKSTT